MRLGNECWGHRYHLLSMSASMQGAKMGLFSRMGSKAMGKMANDYFQQAWQMGFGCPGRPPVQATRAIQDAAVLIYEQTNNGRRDTDALRRALERYADSVSRNDLQISVGSGVLFGIFNGLQGYEWAASYVSQWDLRKH